MDQNSKTPGKSNRPRRVHTAEERARILRKTPFQERFKKELPKLSTLSDEDTPDDSPTPDSK